MKKVNFFLLLQIFSFTIIGQPMDWLSLTHSPDWNVNDLCVYNNSLIAAGDFSIVGGTQAHRVAAWNGSSWSALGAGLNANGPSVQKVIVHNNELYAAGRFDSAGTILTKNIAKWNGTSWLGFGTSCDGEIYSLATYSNEIYAGGTFTNIGGTTATCIAKWNGTNWQSVSTGIYGVSVNDLYVYQNKLFALGRFDKAGEILCNNIACWNGNVWDSVSEGVTGAAMIEWQGNLLVGSSVKLDINYSPPKVTEVIKQWNGANWTVFSDQDMINVRKFIVFNNKLYCSGGLGTGPAGYSYVMVWDQATSTWSTVGSGVNNQIPALCEYNSELYCGGRFNTSTGGYHNYIAKWGISTGLENNLNDEFEIKIYPNPTNGKLFIEAEKMNKISVTNFLAQTIFNLNNPLSKQEIDLNAFSSGIYFLKMQSETQQKVFKIIKD